MNFSHEVTYRLTPRMVTRLALELTRLQALSIPVLLWAAFVFVGTTSIGMRDETVGASFLLFSIAMPGLLLALALPALLFVIHYRRFLTLGDRIGTITHEFYNDGLITRTDKGQSRTEYRLFDGYTRTNGGYLLRLAGSGLFYIPVDQSNHEFNDFLQSKLPAIHRNHNWPIQPLVAAGLNVIAPGSGYLYLGKKQIVAVILMSAFLFFLLTLLYFESSSLGNWRLDLAYVLVAIALGIDAYNEAHYTRA